MKKLTGGTVVALLASALLAVGASAQTAAPARPLPTIEQQIAAAVLPMPKALRDSATVMGYRAATGKLEVIRVGTNGMTCLALFAIQKSFHVACYQNGMEPFMARGRELRAQGVKGAQVDSVRFKEVKAGKIKMPKQAMMYQIFGGDSSWDAATGKVTGGGELFVLYMPFATSASSGLSPVPTEKGPWIMFPGTPKAHMMLSGDMAP